MNQSLREAGDNVHHSQPRKARQVGGCQRYWMVDIKAQHLAFAWHRDNSGLIKAGENLKMECGEVKDVREYPAGLPTQVLRTWPGTLYSQLLSMGTLQIH